MKLDALIAARAKDGPSQSPKSSPAIRPEQSSATAETTRFILSALDKSSNVCQHRTVVGLTYGYADNFDGYPAY